MNPKEGAAAILKRIETAYIPKHNYQYVNESEFRHLDLKFYGDRRAILEANGFRYLCDKEDITLAQSHGKLFHRIMIRVLVSGDGRICASLYHPKVRALWLRIILFILRKKLGRVLDLETEFSDGSFICTSNASLAGNVGLPKLISSEFFEVNAAADRMLDRHLKRISDHAKKYSVAIRQMHSADDTVAMQNRMNALKSAYRGQIGGITKEELDRLSPEHPDITAEVFSEIQKINAAKQPNE